MDKRYLNLVVVEFARLKIIHILEAKIPKDLWLDIGDVRFTIRVEVEPKKK